ncbi:outer membrane beta-barrel protein [Pedobacter roseus]|uniref:Outer membrane beta-barrel protein n=1 Tax=Pedobacter roseus TaxID=336820 RepID=A0A7G9QIH4_9SPHI|nr:outer membrane beta-barrel protein [Pedobacter roseus]QNN43149.1 outer membrane beta-barrel protein [Pedobacter roseus]
MKRFFLLLQLLLPIISLAQSNFKKGFIINNNKDTISGFIDYREQINNPVSINFKRTVNGEADVFGLKDLLGFEVEGMVNFKKYVVTISLSKTNREDLSVGIDTSNKIDAVFLKVLQSGENITLFSYQDNIKLRYYVLEKGNLTPVELIRNIYYDPQNNSVTLVQNKYISQIQELLRRFNLTRSESELKGFKFYNNDLIKMATFINNKSQEKAKFSSARFFAGAGVSISQARYKGANELNSTDARGNTSIMPMASVGIDLFFNPAVRKLIFRTELSFLTGKYNLSVTSEEAAKALITHEFNQSVINLTPQLIYNFYNTDKIKVFGGIGLGLNLASYNKNQRTRFNALNGETFSMEEVKLEKFYFSFPINLGVVVNKRVEFLLGASVPEAISDYLGFKVEIKRYKLGVRYLFGKN